MHPVFRDVRVRVDLRQRHVGDGPLRCERRWVRNTTRSPVELRDAKCKQGRQRPGEPRKALHGREPGYRNEAHACDEEPGDDPIELPAPRRERRHGQGIVDADDKQRSIRRGHAPPLQICVQTRRGPAGTASRCPMDTGAAAQGDAEGEARRKGRLHLIAAGSECTRITEDEQPLRGRRKLTDLPFACADGQGRGRRAQTQARPLHRRHGQEAEGCAKTEHALGVAVGHRPLRFR